DPRQRCEREIFPAQIGVVTLLEGGFQEPARARVRPTMVRTGEHLDVGALSLADEIATMAAAVEEHTDLSVVATYHDHRLQADLTAYEIAGLWHLAAVSDVDPHFVPDRLEFAVEHVRIAVEAPMNVRPADQLIERQALDGRMHQAFSGQQPGAPRIF